MSARLISSTVPIGLWRLALALATLGFLSAALYLATTLVQRQDTLEATNLSNVTPAISRATAEFARLEQRISEFAMDGRAVDKAEVATRIDVVANRIRSFQAAHVTAFLKSSPRNIATVEAMKAAVADARAALPTLEQPGAAGALLDRIEPVFQQIMRMSVDAFTWNTARVAGSSPMIQPS